MARYTMISTLLVICISLSGGVLAEDAISTNAAEAAVRQESAFRLPAEKRPANWVVLSAGELGAILDRTNDGVRVLSLFDRARHRQLLSKTSAPLFEIALRGAGSKERLTLRADAGWRQVRATPAGTANHVEIVWQSPSNPRLGELRVVAVASPDASAGAIRWTLRAECLDKHWCIRRVVFPQIALDMSGKNATLLFPRGPGGLKRGPWSTENIYSGTYPSGWTTMQFMAAYDQEQGTGLYFGLHDPFGGTKELRAVGRAEDQSIRLCFDLPAENLDTGGNGFDSPGQAVWQVLRGDWFDAAMIYRGWVRAKARWFPKLTADGRADTPRWMRELPMWILAHGAPATVVPAVDAFVKAVGTPSGVHWYKWHQIPFDNDYPHYFPAVAGFAEAVHRLQTGKVHVMPYINGRLWDTRDKGLEDFEFTRLALPAATKHEAGKPFIERYGSKERDGSRVRLAVMCPSTELWQKTIRQIVLRLMNQGGVHGVYIDQVAAAAPVLCADHSHPHPAGGGHWWTESYWKLLDAIRQAMPADRMLTTECNAEPYLRCFDGYLTWHWCYDGQVPAFPAVYSGAIQMFGRAYRGGNSKELALRMKVGQQLVFGEQIGWFSPEAVQEAKGLAFVRQAVGLRWTLRRYFYAGEMARPPKLAGAMPTVRADWQWDHPGWVTTDAVLTGAYALPGEHRCVLLFANVSDQPVTAHLKLDAAAYHLSGDKVKVTTVTAAGRGESFASPARLDRDVAFPAQTVFAWELSP